MPIFQTRKGIVTITRELFSFNKVLEKMLGAWRKSKFTHIIRALFLLISQIRCDDYGKVTLIQINTAMRYCFYLNTNKICKTHIDKTRLL